MFSKLTVNSKQNFNQLGLLSESLIYYQQSNLILDSGSFLGALRIIGYENMVELISEGELSINLNSQSLGAGNYEGTKYMISAFSSKNHSKDRIITDATENLWGRNILKQQEKHLIRLIGEHKYSKEYINLLAAEILDIENFKDSIVTVSKGVIERNAIEIEVKKENNGLFDIKSNCDTNLISDSAFLICTGSGLIYDSMTYSSEMVTNSNFSTYPASRLQRIIDKRLNSEKQISNFHKFVLPEFYDLQSTVDSGVKNFDEFMELWRQAKKFKVWLKDEEPNAELLSSYIKKISEDNWLDRLPVKTLRWILFTAVGLVTSEVVGGVAGSVAGITASSGVSFFNDLLF
ncbi:MAG: hypothetical protein IPJ39_14650 [Saprospiraceae bacterium]|nr:hypothetical protein [Saprospiraceae bacterium]